MKNLRFYKKMNAFGAFISKTTQATTLKAA
jgi:hypothetical protein